MSAARPFGCRSCRFADPTVLHNVDGDGPAAVLLCRRYPPVPVYEADTEGIAPSWPLVHEQEWCGEWKEATCPECRVSPCYCETVVDE